MSGKRTYHRVSVSIIFAGAVLASTAISASAGLSRPAPAPAAAVTLAAPAALQAASERSPRPADRPDTPRQIARAMLRHRFGWKAWQFKYLNRLWACESGWNRYAANPYSGAYGIPQAVPGSKMASAGPGWRWNARTQIRWGLRYIQAQYRTPYRAWVHQRVTGWY